MKTMKFELRAICIAFAILVLFACGQFFVFVMTGGSHKEQARVQSLSKKSKPVDSTVVMQPVKENRTKTVTYTVKKVVRETKTKIDPVSGKEVSYSVARFVPECRTKTVDYVVTKMVPVQKADEHEN